MMMSSVRWLLRRILTLWGILVVSLWRVLLVVVIMVISLLRRILLVVVMVAVLLVWVSVLWWIGVISVAVHLVSHLHNVLNHLYAKCYCCIYGVVDRCKPYLSASLVAV